MTYKPNKLNERDKPNKPKKPKGGSMKSFFPIFVVLFLFLFSSLAFSEVITQPLVEKMEETGVDELIPINVVMKEQADPFYLMNLVKGKEISERRRIVIDYLKQVRDGSQKRVLSYLKEQEERGEVERIRSLWLGNMVCFKATEDVIKEVAKFPGVKSIDWDEERMLLINSERFTTALPTGREIVWNLTKVRAPEVWGLGYTGTDIIVSVLDTGVRYTHWDLADHIWTNPGEIPNNGVDDDGNGYVDDYYGYDFYNNDSNPMDDMGHGTHCAGTVAGDGTAGSQTGVAPDARIMSLKVLSSSGGGNESDCWEAMQYTIDNGGNIISMSLGWSHAWSPDRPQWRNTCNTVLAGGVIMSVAAGNEGNSYGPPDNVRTPGDCPPPWLHPDQSLTGGLSAVMTIGATDINDNIASFSSRGPVSWEFIAPWYDYPYSPEMGLIDPDISAPGVDIKSLSYSSDNGYVSGWNGTSMATPHVAGAMALILSKNSGIAPAVMDSILELTSVDLGSAGKDNDFGAGRLDCYEALLATPNLNQPDIYYISNIVDDAGGNNNGILDPGETVDLIVTLRNSGLDATNVEAKLRESNTYITVADSEATFGDIPQGATADNSSNPYIVSASPTTPEGEVVAFTLLITCAEGDTFYRDFNLTVGNPQIPVDYYDHDIGNVRFTVTNQGICGFMDDGQAQGSGFKYPISGSQHLFIGSVWAGNSASYVVNRDFSGENAGDWEALEGVFGDDTLYSDQDSWAKYDDAGMSSPKNLTSTQDGWAWSDVGGQDYVIMRYIFRNEGSSAINGLYFGQFMDWDIGDAYSNTGGVDMTRHLIYMYGSGTKYAGVGLLDPSTSANVTFVYNPDYVYPNASILDSDKIQFLNGSISTQTASPWDDWSICVSAGPFNVGVGDSAIFAVVILGGEGVSDIQQNYDSAQARYPPEQGIAEQPDVSTEPRIFNISSIYPQPFSSVVNIEYTIPKESEVALQVYDVSGRLIRTIINTKQSSGIYTATWDGKTRNGKKVTSGVYFCRLSADDRTFTRKMLMVR